MSGVATAIAGSAIIGGVIGNKANKDAASAQNKATGLARDAQLQANEQARDDLFQLFPSAQQSAQQGFQGALDVFSQSIPQQQQAFTQGNVGAQQAILAGLPQMQNALLGGNIDYSQFQPVQVNPLAWQQVAPQQQPPQPRPMTQQDQIDAAMAGRGNIMGSQASQQAQQSQNLGGGVVNAQPVPQNPLGGIFGAQLQGNDPIAQMQGQRLEEQAQLEQQQATQQIIDNEVATNEEIRELTTNLANASAIPDYANIDREGMMAGIREQIAQLEGQIAAQHSPSDKKGFMPPHMKQQKYTGGY